MIGHCQFVYRVFQCRDRSHVLISVGRLTNDHTKIMRGHAISHGIVRTEREREIEHERSRQARTTERPCANHHSKRTSPPEAASHPTERGTEGSEAEGGEAPADGSTSPSIRRPPIDPHSPVNTFLSKDVLTPASSGAIAEGDRA